jgi:hypothetical protein
MATMNESITTHSYILVHEKEAHCTERGVSRFESLLVEILREGLRGGTKSHVLIAVEKARGGGGYSVSSSSSPEDYKE